MHMLIYHMLPYETYFNYFPGNPYCYLKAECRLNVGIGLHNATTPLSTDKLISTPISFRAAII